MPQALLDKPDIFPDMRPYWETYGNLVQSRSETGRIPVSETLHYLTVYPLRKSLMLRVVRELDDIHVAHVNEKLKSKQPKTKPRKPHGSR